MDPESLEPTDWRKQESLRSVLIQIAVVGSLLTLAVFFAYQRGVDRQQSTAAIERARGLVRADTPAGLREAVQVLAPALQSSVRGQDAHAVTARALAELAAVHQEKQALAGAQAHLEAARQGESEVEERVSAEALLAVNAGHLAEALRLLEPRIHQGVRRLDLEYVLARAQLASGDRGLALKTLARAAEIASGEPRIHALRGELLLEAGQVKEAVASFRRALAGNGLHPGARLGLAVGLAREKGDPSLVEAVVAELRREGVFTPALAGRVPSGAPVPALASDTP